MRLLNSLELPGIKEKKKILGCQFESGLNLIVAWKNGVGKVSSAEAAVNRKKFFKFIWRLRYVKADGNRTSIDLGYWPALSQDTAIEASQNIKAGVAPWP